MFVVRNRIPTLLHYSRRLFFLCVEALSKPAKSHIHTMLRHALPGG